MAKNPWEEDYGKPASGMPWQDKYSYDSGPGAVESFLSGAGDALTFGWGDELLGLGAGLIGMNGEDVTNWSRLQQKDAQSANPWAYGGGQLAGAFVPGLGLGAPLRAGLGATGKSFGLMSRLGASTALGGVGGAAYGAGSANGEDLGGAALEGAMWGAPMGLAGQAVFGELAPALFKSASRAMSPQKRVVDEMAGMSARMGDTPAQFGGRLAAAPDEAVLGDVVAGGPELLRDAAVRPSRGRNELDQVFTDRNRAIAQQTSDDLWGTLGAGIPRDAANRVRSLTDIQETAARPLYTEVYQQRVQAVPKAARDFVAFNSRGGARFAPAVEEARESMRRVLGPDVTDDRLMQLPEFWHRILHNVEDRVGRAMSAAKMDPLGAPMGMAISDMVGDSRRFNDVVRSMLGPKFRKAQDIYAGAARSKMAEEFGADMVKSRGDLALGEVANRLGKMTAAERQHAQYGALSALDEMMRAADTGTGMANVLRPIIGNQSKRRTLQHIFGQSQGFDDLMRRIETRDQLFQNTVKAGIGRGPQTAEKLTGAKALNDRVPSTGNMVADLARFLASKGNDRYSEEVSNEIIRILSMPVRRAEAEIAQAGGMQAWLKSRNALAQAQRQATQLPQERQRLMASAIINGVYAPIYGGGASSAGGL